MNKKKAHLMIYHEHQRIWQQAFAQGLRRHGYETEISTAFVPADVVVIWGVRRYAVMQRQRVHGGEICILERGPVDYPTYVSVSFGGELSRRAEFRGPFEDGSRWNRLFPNTMKEWIEPTRASNKRVVVMCQVPTDAACRSLNMRTWPTEIVRELRARHLPAYARPHPNLAKNLEPLGECFRHARAVVTWNSTAGVDAVLAGVPTVAFDEGSMAYDVASHCLNVLDFRPDRTKWAHWLAWCQYSIEEMRSGYCWEVVGSGHTR